MLTGSAATVELDPLLSYSAYPILDKVVYYVFYPVRMALLLGPAARGSVLFDGRPQRPRHTPEQIEQLALSGSGYRRDDIVRMKGSEVIR